MRGSVQVARAKLVRAQRENAANCSEVTFPKLFIEAGGAIECSFAFLVRRLLWSASPCVVGLQHLQTRV
jgi:hypothetical protein